MKTLDKVVFCVGVAALTLAAVGSLVPKAVATAIATLVRDQDNPARHTFQAHCVSNGFPAPSGQIVANCSIPVPAGREYVITAATASGTSSTFDPVLVAMTSDTGGVSAGTITGSGSAVVTPYNSAVIGGYNENATATFVYETHGPIYADAGGFITVSAYPFVHGLLGGPGVSVQMNIQGYYVTLP